MVIIVPALATVVTVLLSVGMMLLLHEAADSRLDRALAEPPHVATPRGVPA